MAVSAQAPIAIPEPAELCPGCGTPLLGKFCHRCGEKKFHPEELRAKHFALHAVHEFTHLDSRVFATLRYLFTRPGFLTQEFVAGRKARYMKPLSMFLAASALLLLVNSIRPHTAFDVQFLTQRDHSGMLDKSWEKLAAKKHVSKEIIVERIQQRVHRAESAAQFAGVLALAVMLAVVYRRRYFVGHLVFALHYLSFTYLCAVLLWPTNPLLDSDTITAKVLLGLRLLGYFIFLIFSLKRVYSQKTGITVLKGILVYGVLQLVMIITPIMVLVGAVIATVKA